MHKAGLFPLKADTDTQIDFVIDILNLDVPRSDIHLDQLTGGITNAVFLLNVSNKKYIIRVYGNHTEEIINRKIEQDHMMTINIVSIYAIFDNGMIVSYVEGSAIDLPMMRDSQMCPRIARSIARFHKVTYFKEENHQNEIFGSIKKFLQGLEPDYVNEKTGQKIDIKSLEKRYDEIQEELNNEISNSKICLCHNDILSANVLFDGENINLCDYEYSCYTWPEFDIANHFFEYCGFECDLINFPSKTHQKLFMHNYLSELYDVTIEEIETNERFVKMTEDWIRKVGLLVKLSCFFWGTWAYFQAINSEVIFPYFEYAQTRIKLMNLQFPLQKEDPLVQNGPLVSLE